jgi:hypothetical protein
LGPFGRSGKKPHGSEVEVNACFYRERARPQSPKHGDARRIPYVFDNEHSRGVFRQYYNVLLIRTCPLLSQQRRINPHWCRIITS